MTSRRAQLGDAAPEAFDCSELVKYAYLRVGMDVGATTWGQYDESESHHVDESQLRPGDLVFYDDINHVGMYVGDGMVVMSTGSKGVHTVALHDPDWWDALIVRDENGNPDYRRPY